MIIYICTTGENELIEAIFEDKRLAIQFLEDRLCDKVTKVYTEATPELLTQILEEMI